MKTIGSALTAAESAALLSHVEGTAVKHWHVRRQLSDIHSSEDGGRGRTRLYTIDDLSLARLGVRLEQEGLSAWVVRAVLANHAEALVKAWRSDVPVAFAVRGVSGRLVQESDVASLPRGGVAVSLRSIRAGLAQHISRIRRENPTIPLYNRRIPVRQALLDAPEGRPSW